ncbi:type IV pilus modification protein PilV [Shewanella psychropiezotolerans]|uniref:Type IV pilus modification protein PilV n=1 Tax=Shewanella psychropiezotolerans TaxID=2593655 RepID=A0ABX5X1X6_9GAMM|nr:MULTISPECIES: type IV pilus modification protein PilV [Shewanella]MPY20990.1 type IV pilus modification protein PilV [Shewanella sp. YLB-07]MPY21777.1 type IV pilus modification protein PilV [Shewanella sp. YLB-07]QDO85328.1 type IV pilus modification protein PilV [Shewanella psychropiezotolerans]
MNHKSNGFSLVEVLVSLVILVIGLIGIFNLHLVAKRGSFESFQQTQASYYAIDIINRMKLNRSQLVGYAGTYAGNLSEPSQSCDVALNVGGGNAGITCTNVQTRAWDLYGWEQSMNGVGETKGTRSIGGLDTPTACIQVSGTGDVLVVMTWRGIRAVSDGAANAADFVKSCGTANKRRRAYSISTVII